ncbi:hypothetical protein [Demequina maris]|uniref:hypothetical protein n=1 Tax=Demequina maris TaxID=1638982 RepID=UPI0007853DE0|nr:hypothetical protein [Demequina maris]
MRKILATLFAALLAIGIPATAASATDTTIHDPCTCMVYKAGDNTAWAAGERFVDRGNWATFTQYGGVGKTVPLLAGKKHKAGVVGFFPAGDKVLIHIRLYEGAAFADGDAVKIEAYESYEAIPKENPSPGHFMYKEDPSDPADPLHFDILVDKAAYYAVHVDVVAG